MAEKLLAAGDCLPVQMRTILEIFRAPQWELLRRAPISGNQEWSDGMGEGGTGRKEGMKCFRENSALDL